MSKHYLTGTLKAAIRHLAAKAIKKRLSFCSARAEVFQMITAAALEQRGSRFPLRLGNAEEYLDTSLRLEYVALRRKKPLDRAATIDDILKRGFSYASLCKLADHLNFPLYEPTL